MRSTGARRQISWTRPTPWSTSTTADQGCCWSSACSPRRQKTRQAFFLSHYILRYMLSVCVCMCVMSLNIKLWVTNSSQKGSSFEQTCYQSSNHKISSILLLLCKIIGMNCGNVTSLETVTMSLNL